MMKKSFGSHRALKPEYMLDRQSNQETISRRTLSQQAEALIPHLTAQQYLPNA